MLIVNGQGQIVYADRLKVGKRILVRPGEVTGRWQCDRDRLQSISQC